MVDQITFRTNDPLRWGAGAGQDLTAQQIDINFWVTLTRLAALEDHQDGSAGIDFITVTGNQMTIHLTNHLALGPFQLPIAAFNFRGEWEADQTYAVNDVVTVDSSVYLVIFPIANSGAFFAAGQNDGAGHNWWAQLIAAPPSELPDSGSPGGVLMMTDLNSPASAVWTRIPRNYAFFIEEPPNPMEVIFRYIFTETVLFKQGLPRSAAGPITNPVETQFYDIYINNDPVGYLEFLPSPAHGSPEELFFWPHDQIVDPGDVMTIVAPSVVDPHMTGLAVTLVGTLISP